jgi:hypothetical protein
MRIVFADQQFTSLEPIERHRITSSYQNRKNEKFWEEPMAYFPSYNTDLVGN